MGNAVRLRRTTTDDIDFVVGAEQDGDARPLILPWHREQHVAALRDPDLAHFIVETTADGQPVGFVILAGLWNPHRSLEFRRVVIVRKRRGYGRAAVRLVKEFAFTTAGAHRLWLDVKEHNQRARALYEAEGFVVEGLLRECLKEESGFGSLVVMALLVSDWRSLIVGADLADR